MVKWAILDKYFLVNKFDGHFKIFVMGIATYNVVICTNVFQMVLINYMQAYLGSGT